MKGRINYILFALIFLFVAVVAYKPITRKIEKNILNFEECAREGFAITQTVPKKCTTPNGLEFYEEITGEPCKTDLQCEAGDYCKSGLCRSFNISSDCKFDSDCVLIDLNDKFACCGEKECGKNLSNNNWIAVNKQDFSRQKSGVCRQNIQCDLGQENCDANSSRINTKAVCQFRICEKKSL